LAIRIEQFDFHLDPDQIAQQPLARRDAARLMHVDRAARGLADHRFSDLPELLAPGDLLVLNDTRVLPAKFALRRKTGGRIEALFIEAQPDRTWTVMLKGARRCKPGEWLEVCGAAETQLQLQENLGKGRWRVGPHPPCRPAQLLERVGSAPLPPYIRRPGPGPAGDEQGEIDRQRYQTVFSRKPGAVAAPTAGLHFTPELLEALDAKGVARAFVTLHVGLGTFLPVQADRPDEHTMHTERYELPAETAEAIAQARKRGGRVVAVGTTTVRVLETVAAKGPVVAAAGTTDIFLYPPAPFRCVDALITNFHLPRSTLLMLVAAFAAPGSTEGIEWMLEAYRQAIARGYRFYSYGDAMLIT
jgi:S-adenosylmethionine:tRNA ribosyltransferase-isomerase